MQEVIDQADEGETIELKGRIYKGPVLISKPITLRGKEGTKIQGNGPYVIKVTGQGVTLKGIHVQQKAEAVKDTAILVEGINHRIKNVNIETKSLGIHLNDASENKLSSVSIKGEESHHGVLLTNSSSNHLEHHTISHVLDGFYIENSHQNMFRNNTVRQSRYGFHLMFSENLTLKGNHSTHNVIGAMIMETKGTTVTDNTFDDNKSHVHSYGLQLFNADDTTVQHNVFSSNRIGIKIEKSNHNYMSNNVVTSNFIGLQLQNAVDNEIHMNTFLGNVSGVQEINSNGNDLKRNYWDEGAKVDLNQDGMNDLAFKADPFFLLLTNRVPEYQLFFQSPGMTILQSMLKSPDHLVLSDDEPLMTTMTTNKDSHSKQHLLTILFVSLSMMAVSMIGFRKWRN
ncbi:NosD domain-containing protein [Bacillus sp. CGMCC 1.16541]|uniref:right-handed parallel beta-helix repeat-containing protein n=1 Tax=Bacillus sp. CGMCC 1.16541 TaxID=2185143 RepID=UPI0013A54423|nr:NosD domain-containing protein [Bacillus sp. CGMCC 1.16541]